MINKSLDSQTNIATSSNTNDLLFRRDSDHTIAHQDEANFANPPIEAAGGKLIVVPCEPGSFNPSVIIEDVTESIAVPVGCNRAVLTGPKTGLLVISVNGPNGHAELEKFPAAPPSYWTFRPDDGSIQTYYFVPKGKTLTAWHENARGFAINYEDSFAIVDGSRSRHGDCIAEGDLPIAQAPDWMFETHLTLDEPSRVYPFDPTNCEVSAAKLRNLDFAHLVGLLSKHEAWRNVFSFDEFEDNLVCKAPPFRMDAETTGLSEADVGGVVCWIESEYETEYTYFETVKTSEGTTRVSKSAMTHVTASHDMVRKAIIRVAKKRTFHPVRDYLNRRRHGDGTILDFAATKYFGATEESIDNVLFRKSLIAAVARIYKPGCQHDVITVLHGKQGYRKSSMVKALFDPFYADNLPDLKSRDGSMYLNGVWGYEVPEMDRMSREELSTIKAYISRRDERYRAFAGKDMVKRPRQVVFWGTTNDDDFLRDVTGSRRYWILSTNQVIPTISTKERDELWAAAKACYDAGERWWLTEDEETLAEAARKPYQFVDAWTADVKTYLAKSRGKRVETNTVLRGICSKAEELNKKNEMRVAACLKGLGYTQDRDGVGRYWVPPKEPDPTDHPETERIVSRAMGRAQTS